MLHLDLMQLLCMELYVHGHLIFAKDIELKEKQIIELIEHTRNDIS
jgi:hypothetical protein